MNVNMLKVFNGDFNSNLSLELGSGLVSQTDSNQISIERNNNLIITNLSKDNLVASMKIPSNHLIRNSHSLNWKVLPYGLHKVKVALGSSLIELKGGFNK